MCYQIIFKPFLVLLSKFSRPGSVQATVNNIFEETTATQETVDQAINSAIANPDSSNGLLVDATFTGKHCLFLEENLTCMSNRIHYFKKRVFPEDV